MEDSTGGASTRVRPPPSPLPPRRVPADVRVQIDPRTAFDVSLPPHARSSSHTWRRVQGEDGVFDVLLEDLKNCGVIGSGSSGVVQKVQHLPTGNMLAVKARAPRWRLGGCFAALGDAVDWSWSHISRGDLREPRPLCR